MTSSINSQSVYMLLEGRTWPELRSLMLNPPQRIPGGSGDSDPLSVQLVLRMSMVRILCSRCTVVDECEVANRCVHRRLKIRS